jgi:alkylation response protein AidB-like acyl-CoA dehydrogenase
MERLAYDEFSIHRMAYVSGVFGWPEPMPPLVKYIFQYLFVQGEFGLMCPISMTDTGINLMRNQASPKLKAQYLDRMLAADPSEVFHCAPEGSEWRITGDKWFCSSTDAEVILLLARTEGAPAGSRGLSLFLVPRVLPDGSHRIVKRRECGNFTGCGAAADVSGRYCCARSPRTVPLPIEVKLK